MKTKHPAVKDVEIEVATRQAELQAYMADTDIVELTLRRDETRATKDALRQPEYQDQFLQQWKQRRGANDEQASRALREAQEHANGAALEAETALREAENFIGRLEDKVRPLRAMLTGAARATHAQPVVEAAAKQVAVAARALADAQATEAQLQTLLADAQAAYAAEVGMAARDVLSAAKICRTASAGTSDRTQVHALESALALAQGEKDGAHEALTAAETAHQRAVDTLESAQDDADLLEYECALYDIAPLVLKQRKARAQHIGPAYFPGKDLLKHINALEHAERERRRVEGDRAE